MKRDEISKKYKRKNQESDTENKLKKITDNLKINT